MASSSSSDRAILEQAIHKIPGNPVQPKKEKQGYVDLSTKSKSELLELIERQNKLLSKTAFINNLPDKGKKIITYKHQLEEELTNREKSDELSNVLLQLNINGREALDRLEWEGNCNPGQCNKRSDNVTKEDDDDDESSDPLKMFATHSGTSYNKRIDRILPPEVPLIKPSDIEDIEEHSNEANEHNEKKATDVIMKDDNFDDEPYVKNLCEKFDKFSNEKKQDKYLPHRTLKHHKETVEQKPKKPYWEVTAATPPVSVYNSVKLISLESSVKLQIQHTEKLKEVQMKHATEKLKAFSGKGIGVCDVRFDGNASQFRNPRGHYESESSSDDDDKNDKYHSCNEEEDPDENRGGVTFYNLIDN